MLCRTFEVNSGGMFIVVGWLVDHIRVGEDDVIAELVWEGMYRVMRRM